MQPLHIGIITPGYASMNDRGLPAVTDLVRQVASDHRVRVISLRHPAWSPGYALDGAMVHPLGAGKRAGVLGRTRLLYRAVALARRLHRQQAFDVLHALWADEAGAVAVIAGRMIGRPVMVSVLGGELVGLPEVGYGTALGRGGRWTVDLALRRADLVTVGSSILREILVRRIPPERVRSLPLGVDVSRFSPTTGGGPSRTILHVASLEPVKDQVTLLRAFAKLASEQAGVRLVVCGDGHLRPALERLSERLGVAELVEFRGSVPRERLPDAYRAAVLLAVSSHWEAQSLVAVEAAACGIPVVGTRVGCLADLGDGALTVPVGDHVALAGAMATVLDDAARRATMGQAARASALATFDLVRTTEAFVDAYRALAAAVR